MVHGTRTSCTTGDRYEYLEPPLAFLSNSGAKAAKQESMLRAHSGGLALNC